MEFGVVPPGEGESPAPGVIFKVTEAETGGTFSIVEHPYEPRALIPPHVHETVDQITYVVEGTVGIRVGDVEVAARAGTYVRKPRGVPHAHWNPTDARARVLEITFPGGFEDFFRGLSLGAAPDELAAYGVRYGTRFLPEWIPELSERYGVSPPGR